jgi:hypothetical protein
MRLDWFPGNTDRSWCKSHDLTSNIKVSSRSTDMVGDRLSNV